MEQALALSHADRAKLASGLLASLDEDQADDAEVERLLSKGTERHMAMLASGEAQVVIWGHVNESHRQASSIVRRLIGLPFRLHPLAEDDLVKTWAWFEAQEGTRQSLL